MNFSVYSKFQIFIVSLFILLYCDSQLIAQCDPDIQLDIDINSIALSQGPNDSCRVDFNYTIVNNGQCDVDVFDYELACTSPEGMHTDTITTLSSLASGASLNLSYSSTSDITYDDINTSCFDASQITITHSLATNNPPMTLLESIDCGMGFLGDMVVCVNNNSVICDDSQCAAIPQTCDVNIVYEIDTTSFVLNSTGPNECSIDFDVVVLNNGACDVGTFDVDFTIASTDGNFIHTHSFAGPIASEGSTVLNVQAISPLLFDNVSGLCFDPMEIKIEATTSLVNPAQIETMTVMCATGSGTMSVCSNNTSIVCDDSNCIPPNCDINLEYLIDTSSVLINTSSNGCELQFDYEIINHGFCDLNGYDLSITIETALDAIVIDTFVMGPLPAGDTLSFDLLVESVILFNGVQCYDFEDISIDFSHDGLQGPTPITTTVICPSGFGVQEVCSNDNDIVCDDSKCRDEAGSCATSIQLAIASNTIVIGDETLTECTLDFFYEVTNNGDCDLSSFDLRFRLETPDGVETFVESVPAPIIAKETTKVAVSYTSVILKNSLNCFTPGDIDLSFTFVTSPLPITVSVACIGEPGDRDVCANDISISCGDCDVTVAQELISFSAKLKGEMVKLDWQIENPENYDLFSVEHRSTHNEFEEIGVVDSRSSLIDTNYGYKHFNPEDGTNYYRIKMIDWDGNISYSNIRIVEVALNAKLYLAPNPASDFINLNSTDGDLDLDQIDIYNLLGQKQSALIELYDKGFRINISALNNGSYFIIVRDQKEIEALKFIKH